MFTFDSNLFLLLNAGATPNAIVSWLAISATKVLLLLIPLYLVVLWLLGGRRRRLTAIALLLALVIAIVLSYLVGLVMFRPRPFMVGLGHALVEHRPNASFPSNHGLAFATCAAVLFMLRRKTVAWVATGLGLVMAWSRIYIGVHYPLDMVGSIIVGLAAAMASLWVMDRHGQVLLALAEETQQRLLAPFARS
ncbi:undecaprenyl-diphosphatase [Pseudaminobacter salicylatoxidans]|uniref:Undecaprenyl-diphosphatase n=1 Tax=Pseudaminobacter salicylatoxidans TaxID=93369 RepID=A0A316BNG3_PSESE|nr:undecaprenyl-diphosphatase [Pseudaminobacter salicylatoxidans]PWJ74861.1 undecaprenyl-diphosphatase [Pseudaminobacter salicylatoxidans]